jgi:hypothetical protein
MSSTKSPMSTSYKAVFSLSILMIFLVIIVGAMTGSKSIGFGIWYWGYTAWKMYNRDNGSLVSLQKIMLWFQAIGFSIALAVLQFSDSEVRRYVDITPLGLIILASLSIGITYFLYKFFIKQQSAVDTNSEVSGSLIEDRYWEQASRELAGERHEATWARAVAGADGDEAKAKAAYLRIRSLELSKNDKKPSIELENNIAPKKSINIDFMVLIVIAIFIALVAYFYIFRAEFSNSSYKDNVNSPPDTQQKVYTFKKCTWCLFPRVAGSKERCSDNKNHKFLMISSSKIILGVYDYSENRLHEFDYKSSPEHNCTIYHGPILTASCNNNTDFSLSFDGGALRHETQLNEGVGRMVCVVEN